MRSSPRSRPSSVPGARHRLTEDYRPHRVENRRAPEVDRIPPELRGMGAVAARSESVAEVEDCEVSLAQPRNPGLLRELARGGIDRLLVGVDTSLRELPGVEPPERRAAAVENLASRLVSPILPALTLATTS